MRFYRRILCLQVVLLLGAGWAHQTRYFSFPETELSSYKEQALSILANPTNWTRQGGWQILAKGCSRIPEQALLYDVSLGLGKELRLPAEFASDPHVTVFIPVTTDDQSREYVGVTFHHRTRKLVLIAVYMLGKEEHPQPSAAPVRESRGGSRAGAP